jgi:hypothetical protein
MNQAVRPIIKPHQSVKKQTRVRLTKLFTPRATLVALGCKLKALGIFDVIAGNVTIPQKTVKHSPTDKLMDAFIAILAGATGMCEVNTRVRPDLALQRAFGRTGCAEQSVVQETLSACTSENVKQMRGAMTKIFRRFSLAARHDYKEKMLMLDIDLTGIECGSQAEKGQKGYFHNSQTGFGRQIGRVVAGATGEVVYDVVFPGNVVLCAVFRVLIQAAENRLALTAEQRRRTVIRSDSGGGTLSDLNWLLQRGYAIHCKEKVWQRTAMAALSVKQWYKDERNDREFGWATNGADEYVRQVKRLVLRNKRTNGKIVNTVLVSSLTVKEASQLLGTKINESDQKAVAQAYTKLYDERAGTIEGEFKADKQTGMGKRNKRSFHGQEMLQMLVELAHNVLLWAREWLTQETEKLRQYGIVRLVRDLLAVSGKVFCDKTGRVKRIELNQSSKHGKESWRAFSAWLSGEQVTVILGKN